MCCHPLASWTPSGPGSPGSSLPQGRKTGSTTHVLTVGAEAGGGTNHRILVHPNRDANPRPAAGTIADGQFRWIMCLILHSQAVGGSQHHRAARTNVGPACDPAQPWAGMQRSRTVRADSAAEASYVLAVACRSNPFLAW